MSVDFPSPSADTADPASLFSTYLRYFRETVVAKAESLPGFELRETRLSSAWTPIELVNHLAFMERRWVVWGFLGEQVDQPWGDSDGEGWRVSQDVTLSRVVARLHEVAVRTEQVLASYPLTAVGAVGGRFEKDPPTLAWICFHVLQEYARHAGHLDVAVELAGGPVGE